MELCVHYGVKRIHGFCNGFQGFVARYGRCVMDLTPQSVADIDDAGGTVLGTLRGQQDAAEVVDCLERMSINIVFIIGGDGTIRGALNIAAEIAERGDKIGVVGIPKTIDNDIMYIDHSFGFQTAFSEAAKVIRIAHVEAKSAPNGVGPGQAHGPAVGIYRLLCVAADQRRRFRADPRGAVPFGR